MVQHGKRANSIVKNMLLHSREGSGEHRPADINALVDESLNLAYHGARAEKPQFNVTLQRDFDPTAGMIEVFPQEITRVFLNLISNGFYAVTKRKTENGESDFEPMLSATTRNLGDTVEIRIRDNGTGIPAEVKEKMFNPFFTTKPAGEGTGLGLSMSHDIIVKQHGGTIDVETEPGQFTEFRIVLPRTSNLPNKAERSDVSVLVLVVDDEPDVEALFRQQFRRDLRAQRFVMDFAISAADALARIATTIEQSLILILSDINMPGMTGLEMLPKVREMRPDVPVIMITAYGDPETRRKAIESGASGLLTKPIDFTLLREEIDTRLAAGRLSRDLRLEERGIVERLDHGVHHVGGAMVFALFQQLPHLAQIGAHRRLQRRDRVRSGSARCRRRCLRCPSWSARWWVCSWPAPCRFRCLICWRRC